MYFPWDRTWSRTHSQRIVLAILSPFYLGHEAVLLFFVLSGFVLSLPYLQGREQSYPQFLLRRILRIYGPYCVALALAVGGVAIFHGHLGMGDWSEQTWSQPVSRKLVLDHVLFLGNYNWFEYNVVFWSLVIEMRVSILFPLLVGLITRIRVGYAVLIAAACPLLYRLAIHYRPSTEPTLLSLAYVSTFIAGIILAQHLSSVKGWYKVRSGWERMLFVATVLVLYCAGHLLPHLSQLATFLGTTGVIVIALTSESAHRLLRLRVLRFLGRISYSMYLVHVPVIFALVFLLHTRVSPMMMFFVYVALALGLATVFNVLVEAPLIRLSHRVGRRSSNEESVLVGESV